jgi:KAP-like P-loop domain-containing protein
MVQQVQERQQSLSHSASDVWLLSGSWEAFLRYTPASGQRNAEFLFPTIAFGLSSAIPKVGKIIDEVVANDPSIPTKELEIQLQKLVLEPLQQLSEESKELIVIIIDGLDKCENEEVQSNIIQLLGSVFHQRRGGGCE